MPRSTTRHIPKARAAALRAIETAAVENSYLVTDTDDSEVLFDTLSDFTKGDQKVVIRGMDSEAIYQLTNAVRWGHEIDAAVFATCVKELTTRAQTCVELYDTNGNARLIPVDTPVRTVREFSFTYDLWTDDVVEVKYDVDEGGYVVETGCQRHTLDDWERMAEDVITAHVFLSMNDIDAGEDLTAATSTRRAEILQDIPHLLRAIRRKIANKPMRPKAKGAGKRAAKRTGKRATTRATKRARKQARRSTR
jgi:peptidyl-tRNA hydrolase